MEVNKLWLCNILVIINVIGNVVVGIDLIEVVFVCFENDFFLLEGVGICLEFLRKL